MVDGAPERYGDARRSSSFDDRYDPAVRIVDYDASWPQRAENELGRVMSALGPVAARGEHVGSTSVPGMAAKPILDLQVSVVAMEPSAAFVHPLQELGYLFAPAPESPDYHFFALPAKRPRSFHLHVCAAGSHHEFTHVAVRDFLRHHSGEAVEYTRIKREVVSRHPYDRLAYIAGKKEYVDALERRAVAWLGSWAD